jgi:hypothetical protein
VKRAIADIERRIAATAIEEATLIRLKTFSANCTQTHEGFLPVQKRGESTQHTIHAIGQTRSPSCQV